MYVFGINSRTNSDYLSIRHEMFGFYDRDRVCLLRGTGRIFVHSKSKLSFVFKVVNPINNSNICEVMQSAYREQHSGQ